MNILALDLGTTTGWAIYRDGIVISGSQPFKPNRFDGGGMRYVRFIDWLEEVGAQNADHICYEEVRRHIGTTAAHVYGGFLSHLQAWCERRGIPYEGVTISAIKESWTGSAKADKKAMIEVAKAAGFHPTDDNEADALALLHLAMHERKVDEAPRRTGQRSTPDSKPRRRIQMGSVPVARRRIGG